MAKNLVIVESPAKAKTIQKFLGNDYKVMSSFGHIRDLHTKNFSIDVENGFKPLYEIPEDKVDQVKKLKEEADKADIVWLASDEDREGEAIAWHLFEVLELLPDKTRRIVFHEITEPAILEAIQHPRSIDLNLVDAQQARRVLDRIVGFELSPVLWRKIMPGLSAGRVQSVAVRLVAEREKEIKAFTSEPYYRVTAQFVAGKSKDAEFSAELNRHIEDHDAAQAFLESCKGAQFTVDNVTVKPVKRSPAPPFTTSTLQQEAARKLGLSVKQTMRLAQRLYEEGLITYMRTDSVNLSNLALGTISKEIKENIGEQYLKVRHYRTTSKGAQEAHEAIRPTYISNHTITGTPQEKKLYDLIWKRTIASQMADAELEKTTATIAVTGRDEVFVAEGEVVKFDGFLKVYFESTDDNQADDKAIAAPSDLHTLPVLSRGDNLDAQSISAIQRYTQQPNRYTEASLVRRLEELGIGRPSTYAPIISTIQDRKYVEKGEDKGHKREYEVLTLKDGNISATTKSELFGVEKGKLIPTDVGMVVNEFLVKYFPSIMDYNFTAKVENEFDEVAKGNVVWNKEIADFYEDFHPSISQVSSLRLEHKVGERLLGNDPKTGLPVMVKIGRYGPLVQMGSADNENKPRFASLQRGQSIETITLEEAVKLFDLPRTLGDFEGDEVTVGVGQYGPYVKHKGKYASIPKDMSPTALTLEDAVELIMAQRETEAKKVLKTFDEEPELKVMNGRYGPYIVYKKQNVKIPKGKDAEALTLEECREIVADEANISKGTTRRKASRTRTATKKSTTKK